MSSADQRGPVALSESEWGLLERLRRLARFYPEGRIPSRAAAGLLGVGDLVDKGYVQHVRSNGANGPAHHYFQLRALP